MHIQDCPLYIDGSPLSKCNLISKITNSLRHNEYPEQKISHKIKSLIARYLLQIKKLFQVKKWAFEGNPHKPVAFTLLMN